jgi:hypothetical protein
MVGCKGAAVGVLAVAKSEQGLEMAREEGSRSEEAHATWGWVRREARWEAEFVEGASGEQAGLEA